MERDIFSCILKSYTKILKSLDQVKESLESIKTNNTSYKNHELSFIKTSKNKENEDKLQKSTKKKVRVVNNQKDEASVNIKSYSQQLRKTYKDENEVGIQYFSQKHNVVEDLLKSKKEEKKEKEREKESFSYVNKDVVNKDNLKKCYQSNKSIVGNEKKLRRSSAVEKLFNDTFMADIEKENNKEC